MLRKYYDDAVAWGNKPLDIRTFCVTIIIAAGCFLLTAIACQIYDPDMYFLLETGRETVANGIPRVNVWAADGNLGFVAQQWLYCVVLYFVSFCGNLGFSAFVVMETVVLSLVLYLLFRNRGVGRMQFMLALSVILVFSQTYLFKLRPQELSMILLFLECYGIERFMDTGRKPYLWLLPLSTLAEINVHAAFWPFHFCILLAYAAPGFFVASEGRGRREPKSYPSALGWSCLAMAGSLFLNPYGVDAILYVFRAYASGALKLVPIVEMRALSFFDGAAALLCACAALVFVCRKFGRAYGPAVNMAVGFGLLSLLAFRNYMFLMLPLALLMRELFAGLAEADLKIDWRKDVKNYLIPIMLCVDVLLAANLVASASDVQPFGTGTGSQLAGDGMVEYVRDNVDEDDNVFVGFNLGSYFEYNGIRNVYLDARPEIYMSMLNGEKDVLAEYARYALSGGDTEKYHGHRELGNPVMRDEMDAWFEGYDFKFVCVNVGVELFLAGYMNTRDDYRLVEDVSSVSMLVYERIG